MSKDEDYPIYQSNVPMYHWWYLSHIPGLKIISQERYGEPGISLRIKHIKTIFKTMRAASLPGTLPQSH